MAVSIPLTVAIVLDIIIQTDSKPVQAQLGLAVTHPIGSAQPCRYCGSLIVFVRKQYRARHAWLPLNQYQPNEAGRITTQDIHNCRRRGRQG